MKKFESGAHKRQSTSGIGYPSLQVSNCSGEISFSHPKRVKNALRSTTGHRRFADLAPLNIECEIVGELDFHDVIESFSASKARRKDF